MGWVPHSWGLHGSFFLSVCLFVVVVVVGGVLQVEGVLAAVDATKETALGKRFEVKGYPTGMQRSSKTKGFANCILILFGIFHFD